MQSSQLFHLLIFKHVLCRRETIPDFLKAPLVCKCRTGLCGIYCELGAQSLRQTDVKRANAAEGYFTPKEKEKVKLISLQIPGLFTNQAFQG